MLSVDRLKQVDSLPSDIKNTLGLSVWVSNFICAENKLLFVINFFTKFEQNYLST